MMKSVRGVRFADVAAFAAVVALVSPRSFAANRDYTAGDTGAIRSPNVASVLVTAATGTQDATYPASVGDPVFWLDASNTNGWTLSGTDVKDIPSLTGSRHLINELGSWIGWHSGSISGPLSTHRAPFLTEEAAFGGRTVLDFGPGGSQRYLIFDPDPDSPAETPTNIMRRIGTVIQVRNSENGGGWLMGGGETTPETGEGSGNYKWHRETGKAVKSQQFYASAIGLSHMQAPAREGTTYHHGYASTPTILGYDGGWETLTLQCTEASAIATGLGLNDARWNHAGDSGGFRLAEMLIYDRVLTREEIVQVEMYLEQKWFDRNRTGWNGEARLGGLALNLDGITPVAGELNVPAGTTLEVDRLEGGRATANGASVSKTGAGALVLRGAGRYAGKLKLAAGTLSFDAPRPTPALDELPANMYFRFDASDAASTVTTTDGDGREVVSLWRNLAPQKYQNKDLLLRPRTGGLAPRVVRDVFGPGLPVLDFGDNVLRTAGRYLQFTTEETGEVNDASAAGLDHIGTLFAVVGAQRGGGSLLNAPAFTRKNTDTTAFDNPLLSSTRKLAGGIYASDGVLWIDGRRMPTDSGYDHPGYQVAAFEVPGTGNPYFLGVSSDNNNAGGMRIAEIIGYARPMTEREIRDVQAYLSRKWLGRAIPGYETGDETASGAVCDLQDVQVTGSSTIEVPAGRTNVIARLDVREPLLKTGGGTLWVNELTTFGRGRITVKEGDIHVVKGPDVAQTAEIAAGASLHLDASDASTLELDGSSVLRWANADDPLCGIGALRYSGTAPTLNTSEDALLDGKPVVDFGNTGSGRWLSFGRPVYAMRSVYMVLGYHGGGAFIMGSNTGAPMYDAATYDFHGATGGGTQPFASKGIFLDNGHALARSGDIYTNGVSVAFSTPMPTDSYLLLEIHMANAAHASAFARDRGALGDRSGGFRLGEAVIYERELTAREKVATRNALLKKWFGKTDAGLEPLPPAPPVVDDVPVRALKVDGELTRNFDADAVLYDVSGEGVLTKTGAGAVTVKRMSGFAGTLTVAEGTVAVAGADSPVVPKLVTDGLIHRHDSSVGVVSTATNGTEVTVKRWDGANGDGIYAVPNNSANVVLKLQDPDVNGLDTIDMQVDRYFRFKKGDDYCGIDGIKSIFWIIGSQRGGGFLLGGGHDATGKQSCYWHRGQVTVGGVTYQGRHPWCPMLHQGVAFAEAKRANWRRNGATISQSAAWPDGGLSGGWDQLTMIVSSDADTVNADGFAYDGRFSANFGSQGLGEVIFYDRRLSDAERDQVESYLMCKWGKGLHEAATNVTVDVAKGATFDCGESLQHLGGIAGAGTFAGDVSANGLVADAAATDCPTVTGTFEVPAGMTVDVRNLPSDFVTLYIPLVACADFSGLDRGIVLTGEALPQDARVRLVYRNGTLFLKITTAGMVMIVR